MVVSGWLSIEKTKCSRLLGWTVRAVLGPNESVGQPSPRSTINGVVPLRTVTSVAVPAMDSPSYSAPARRPTPRASRPRTPPRRSAVEARLLVCLGGGVGQGVEDGQLRGMPCALGRIGHHRASAGTAAHVFGVGQFDLHSQSG